MSRILVEPLCTNKTTTGAGTAVTPSGSVRAFQVYGTTSSGAGSATVLIEVSNDNSNYETLISFSLTLDTTVVAAGGDGDSSVIPWKYVRVNVSAISGTGAAITANVSFLEQA